MPAADDPGTLRLPPRVDAAAAGTLYRAVAARATALCAIDFSAVESIDSAGVALVRVLCARAGSPLQLLQVPRRFDQLSLAHRVAAGHTNA